MSRRRRRPPKEKPPIPTDTPQDGTQGVRLQKVLAKAGLASRREAEKLIENGHVRVNGMVVHELPVWITPGVDEVKFDNQRIDAQRAVRKKYFILYKPRNVICTNHDPEGRRTVFDYIPTNDQLHCVGRLDGESNGLVLLTNDGNLTNQLTHPKYGIEKTYRVTIKGRISDEEIQKLQKGLWLADKSGEAFKVQATRISVISRQADKSSLEIILREGKNREIRRMLARQGYMVKKLQRIAIGPLKLKGIKSGNFRELSSKEVMALRDACRSATKSTRVRGPRKPKGDSENDDTSSSSIKTTKKTTKKKTKKKVTKATGKRKSSRAMNPIREKSKSTKKTTKKVAKKVSKKTTKKKGKASTQTRYVSQNPLRKKGRR